MNTEEQKHKLLQLYQGFGFQIPKGSKFWNVERETTHKKEWGLQVGAYTHSCHVDTTDFIVLFFVEDSGKDRLEAHSDLWLAEPIVV